MTIQVPKGRRARWIMDLENYDFIIKYRAGKNNANADALSRLTQTIRRRSLEEEGSQNESEVLIEEKYKFT